MDENISVEKSDNIESKKPKNKLYRKILVFGIPILFLALVSAAILTYYGQIHQNVNVQQAMILQGEGCSGGSCIETFGTVENPINSPAEFFTGPYEIVNNDKNKSRNFKLITNYTPEINIGEIETIYYEPTLDAIIETADRLVLLQNIDGSWDWDVTGDSAPSGTSYLNIAGVTAQGLLTAYEVTGDLKYLSAANKTGEYLIAQMGYPTIDSSKRTNAFNILFLYNLGQVSGGDSYTNEANALVHHVLHESNYWTICGSDGCNASELKDAYVTYRAGDLGIAMWDLAPWVEVANLANEESWANDLKTIMNDVSLNPSEDYYVLGLSGIVLATGNIEATQDLISIQELDGSWEDANGNLQDTAYAILALKSVNEMSSAILGQLWLASQSTNGVWLDSPSTDCVAGGCEFAEKNSEAIQALPLTDITDSTLTVNPNEKSSFYIYNVISSTSYAGTITTSILPI